MYSRFWHKFLYDKGLVPTKEPYKKLLNQGMIQGKSAIMEVKTDGGQVLELYVPVSFVDENWRLPLSELSNLKAEDNRFEQVNPSTNVKVETDKEGKEYIPLLMRVEKMSKRLFNVVNPDDMVERYGADCFRMYEMFLGPIEQAKPWDTKGINGVSGFLRKLWMLFFDEYNGKKLVNDDEPTKAELKILHTCIKKVTEDIERFSFNTCVSAFMICVNELRSANCSKRGILDELVRLLAPFAPFTAEELWHQLGHETTVCEAKYPTVNEAYLVQDTISYPVSINGKKRDLVDLPAGMSAEELEKAALALDSVKKHLEGLTVKKIIVVPGRMINIVV
jgi:leucyl-tRNA synthetase